MDDIKIEICIAANVQCPDWLRQKQNLDWLAACLQLVEAGVVVIGPSAPEVCRSASSVLLAQHLPEIAFLLSEA
jgi:hypothetical protein